MKIAFYGSSLLSSYWNGAATYYRGILRDLAVARLRHHVLRARRLRSAAASRHRSAGMGAGRSSIPRPKKGCKRARRGGEADIVVKANGVGVFDRELLEGVIAHARPDALRIFWDVDAAATLDEMRADARIRCAPRCPTSTWCSLMAAARRWWTPIAGSARPCVPVYNALDPSTHFPVPPDPRFACDLAFLGNRLPDREARVEEFFLRPAAALPDRQLPDRRQRLGEQADAGQRPPSRSCLHAEHNAFNCTPKAVLNVARDSMAHIGFSPATRVFEAAGAAACLITDAWEGIEQFLAPGDRGAGRPRRPGRRRASRRAHPERARGDRRGGAPIRVLAEHTYTAARRAGRRASQGALARAAGGGMRLSSSGLACPPPGATAMPPPSARCCKAFAARGHDILFLERDVRPGMPRIATSIPIIAARFLRDLADLPRWKAEIARPTR
jgi:spore maturation protein CgeB